MQQHVADLVRHIVQHHMTECQNIHDDEFTVVITELDADMFDAWQIFCGDIACHALEQLVPGAVELPPLPKTIIWKDR